MQLSQFLQKVLPHEGIYCADVITKEGKSKNTYLDSTEDLAKFILSKNGQANLYHACSSFKVPGSRKKDNVHRVRSLWADIDVRPDKGYNDFPSAFKGISDFLASTKLPIPTTVFTGSGIHLYWTLKQDLEPHIWERYANGLKVLASALKFKIDLGITADASRVLRSPGTLNLKWNKQSKILHLAEDYDINQFAILALQKTKEVAAKEAKDFTPVNADIIFTKCAQMAAFKAGAFISGETWIGVGRILAQCVDGEKLWHEYSALDERYDEAEAAKKWNDSVRFNKATLCSRFKETNPEGCKGCPHNVNTPISFARRRQAQLSEDYTKDVDDKVQSFSLPYGYKYGENGCLIFSSQKKDEEEAKEIKITQYPFCISERSSGQMVDGELSAIVEYWKPKDGWAESKMPISELVLNPMACLAKIGVMVSDPLLMRKYVQTAFDKLAGDKHMIKTYDTFGWKDSNKFLLGERLYYFRDGKLAFDKVPLGPEAASIAGELRPGGRSGGGSIQGWREAAQGLFARGHEWQAVSLLAGCAAILLGLQGDPEGGAMLSLYDAVGGMGKTTANSAGASPWGGLTALSTNAADTVNARMAKLGTLCHLPLVYDEMKRDNPGIAKAFIQSFTVGNERARMSKDGALNRNPRHWRTVMLTSANTELIGAISAGDGSEAMADRVLELHAEKLPLNKGEIDTQLKQKFNMNCGYAGPVILALVLRNIEAVKSRLIETEQRLMRQAADAKLRFRIQLIAAIDVMGRLISESGLLNFDPQYYTDWLVEQITSTTEIIKAASSAELLSRYMRDHVGSTLITKQYVPGNAKRIVGETKTGKVAIRVEEDSGHIVIPRKDIEMWLQEKDRSIKAFIRELEVFGVLLQKNVLRNLGAGTQLSIGQESVLIFNGKHPAITGVVEGVHEDAKIIPLKQDQKPSASAPRLAALSKLT